MSKCENCNFVEQQGMYEICILGDKCIYQLRDEN